jgi:ubiquinone biosynthesis protein UbiJ
MPLSSLICASIETTLNKLLTLDTTSHQRLIPLKGKTVGLAIGELKQPLFFNFSDQRVEVLGQYEGDVTAQLTLDFNALITLKNNGNISELIKSDQLVIDGDIKTLQQFADLLAKLDIDWQEHLSAYTGDVIAFKLGQSVNKIVTSVTRQTTKAQSHVKDYLTEEARVVIGKLEFIHFSDQIDELSLQADNLANKIIQLRDR